MVLSLLLACAPPQQPAGDGPGLAPTLEIQLSASEGWIDQGQETSLSLAVVDDRSAPADLRLEVLSDLDGLLAEPALDAQGRAELRLAELSQGLHRLTATARDPDGNLGTASVELEVNGLPTAAELEIVPATPTTGSELTVRVLQPGIDPEGGLVRYDISWDLNDTPTGILAQTVPGDLVRRGQTWTVHVQSIDSRDSLGGTTSAQVHVANSAPQGHVMQLQPEAPRQGDALVCAILEPALDIDGDAVHYRFSWTVDGRQWVGRQGLTQFAGDTVSRTETLQGQAWTCQATPTDYMTDGTPLEQGVVIAAPAAPWGRVDPGAAWTVVLGEEPGDLLGSTLALAGDQDGDGLGEAWLAAPGRDEHRGAVFQLRGGARGDLSAGALLPRIVGREVEDELGMALAVGDLDGDGIEDLVAGSPGARGLGTEQAGEAWILYGPSTGTIDAAHVPAAILGSEDRGALGDALAIVEGEEGLQIALLAPRAAEQLGGLWLVDPLADLPLAELDDSGAIPLGASAGDGLSAVLASPGDLTGDGIADLVLGLPGYALDEETDAGLVLILDVDTLTPGLPAIDQALVVWTSEGQLARLGAALSPAGDMDGDGLSDLLACAPYANPGGPSGEVEEAGVALLLPGLHADDTQLRPALAATRRWVGTGSGEHVCDAVLGDVDLDGDGQSDLVLGNRWDDGEDALLFPGAAWIFYGPGEGGTTVTADADARIFGPATNSLLGASLAGGQDLTGDGRQDLLIGSIGWPSPEDAEDYLGATILVSGGDR